MNRVRGDTSTPLRRQSVPTPRIRRRWSAVAGVAAAAVVAIAGCGGRASVAIVRSPAPVLCPATAAKPGGAAPRRRFDARQLLGLRIAAARRAASAYGCVIRAIAIDGRRQLLTGDLRFDRVDVYISRDVVYRLVGVY
jgi:hypothetical protein